MVNALNTDVSKATLIRNICTHKSILASHLSIWQTICQSLWVLQACNNIVASLL